MLFNPDENDIAQVADAYIDKLHAVFTKENTHIFWVSVDFRAILIASKVPARDAQKLADELLRALIANIGDKGTLLISAFNFDFPHAKFFDVEKSPVQTGAFGRMVLKNHVKQRTLHPFYSFLVFGAQADFLLNNRFHKSTGEGSIFEWLVDNRAELVTIGHPYTKSLTSVHHAEHVAGVDYRYPKDFSGELRNFGDVIEETCSFYVRDLDMCDFSSFTFTGDKYLRDAGFIHTHLLGDEDSRVLAHNVNMAETLPVLIEDLKKPEPIIVNYYGSKREKGDVIVASDSDRLYLEELQALSPQ